MLAVFVQEKLTAVAKVVDCPSALGTGGGNVILIYALVDVGERGRCNERTNCAEFADFFRRLKYVPLVGSLVCLFSTNCTRLEVVCCGITKIPPIVVCKSAVSFTAY